MLTCFSKKYFGIECPGCGFQRSALSFLHGDFLDSLALFPAFVPFVLFLILGALTLIKPLNISSKWVVIMAIFTFSIMLVHYIMKMTGLAPWYYEAAAHFHY